MAIPLKTRTFRSHAELAKFCAEPANNVNTIVSIVTDNSGQYTLFYLN